MKTTPVALPAAATETEAPVFEPTFVASIVLSGATTFIVVSLAMFLGTVLTLAIWPWDIIHGAP